jgi:DNA-binding MarR family transcriptional regulator
MSQPPKPVQKTARRESARAVKVREVDAIVQGLRRIVKALEVYSRNVESTYGITGPQLWALKTLERFGALPVSRLSTELAVHQTSASIMVARLERRGLLKRVRSAKDRRIVLLSLTREGHQMASRAPEAAQGRLMHGLLAMPEREVRLILNSVDRIVGAMEAENIEATFFFASE